MSDSQMRLQIELLRAGSFIVKNKEKACPPDLPLSSKSVARISLRAELALETPMKAPFSLSDDAAQDSDFRPLSIQQKNRGGSDPNNKEREIGTRRGTKGGDTRHLFLDALMHCKSDNHTTVSSPCLCLELV